MNYRQIDRENAEEIIRECNERFPTWGQYADWFMSTIEEPDFRSILVFNGGSPYSRWQEFSGGSYEIGAVANGVVNYGGDDKTMMKSRQDVFEYEKMMDRGEYPSRICLVKTRTSRMTLFETN